MSDVCYVCCVVDSNAPKTERLVTNKVKWWAHSHNNFISEPVLYSHCIACPDAALRIFFLVSKSLKVGCCMMYDVCMMCDVMMCDV